MSAVQRNDMPLPRGSLATLEPRRGSPVRTPVPGSPGFRVSPANQRNRPLKFFRFAGEKYFVRRRTAVAHQSFVGRAQLDSHEGGVPCVKTLAGHLTVSGDRVVSRPSC